MNRLFKINDNGWETPLATNKIKEERKKNTNERKQKKKPQKTHEPVLVHVEDETT